MLMSFQDFCVILLLSVVVYIAMSVLFGESDEEEKPQK